MRTTTACLLGAGLVLLLAPAVSAETTETTIDDATGDAGPGPAQLGEAGSDVDIDEVTLTSDEDADTSLRFELASFDVRPPDTMYGAAFHTENGFVWAAYGNVVIPFPPFHVEGFYGCQVTDGGHNCTELDGEHLPDASGFRVSLPGGWTPANATLHDPMAAVFTDPLVPAGQDATFETVWPANAHDLASTDASHEVPDDERETSDAASPQAASSSDASTGLGSLTAAGAAGLGAIGLTGVAARRIR